MNNYNPLSAIWIPMEEVGRYEVDEGGGPVFAGARIKSCQRACPKCGSADCKAKERKG